MKEIIQKGHGTLRLVASPVPEIDITSEYIQNVIQEMKQALDNEHDGVAIAAPQINEPLRIFVVSHKVLKTDDAPYDPNLSKVFINPAIIKQSRSKILMEEGCLSVRWWYGEVLRSKQATVEAFDENGISFQMGGSGLLAQIFQHEVDHLNGVLFIDKAEHLEEFLPNTQQ